MSNKILIKLEDSSKRKFPLIYKHIEEEIIDADGKHSNYLYLSQEKNAREESLSYHKPISKLL